MLRSLITCTLSALLLVVGSSTTSGRPIFEALGLIESGNNDAAVGKKKEISRYQIRPAVWKAYAKPGESYLNPQDSLSVAQRVLWERIKKFEHRTSRSPTNFEIYTLWNAPAEVNHPSRVVAERAERFCNLVSTR
jgi:hypothetical protein